MPGVVASDKSDGRLGSQVSVAVGGVNTGVAGQLIGVVCATQVMTGGVVSAGIWKVLMGNFRNTTKITHSISKTQIYSIAGHIGRQSRKI